MKKKMLATMTIFLVCNTLNAQRVTVKTNTLYWLTTTPNLGVEVSAGRNWSMDLSANFNPFTFSGSKASNPKMLHWLVQPELRYWPCKVFERQFWGIHGVYADYNMGGVKFIPFLKDHRYKGTLAGGGISYGYHWAIGKYWGLEASLGVGYLRMEYDKYVCGTCGELEGRFKRNYFGPTKLALSVIYFIR